MHFQEYMRCTSISSDRLSRLIVLAVVSIVTFCSAQVLAHEPLRESSEEATVESPAADEPEAVKVPVVTQTDTVASDVNRSTYDLSLIHI